jgi:hypothetical protein
MSTRLRAFGFSFLILLIASLTVTDVSAGLFGRRGARAQRKICRPAVVQPNWNAPRNQCNTSCQSQVSRQPTPRECWQGYCQNSTYCFQRYGTDPERYEQCMQFALMNYRTCLKLACQPLSQGCPTVPWLPGQSPVNCFLQYEECYARANGDSNLEAACCHIFKQCECGDDFPCMIACPIVIDDPVIPVPPTSGCYSSPCNANPQLSPTYRSCPRPRRCCFRVRR